MHISYFRRPLFIIFAIYVICILLFYRTPLPSKTDLDLRNQNARVEGFLTSPLSVKKDYSAAIIRTDKNLIYVHFPSDFHADMRDRVAVTGYAKEPDSLDISGNFNWAGYLARRRVFTELTAENAEVTQKAPLFYRGLNALRNSILKTFKDNFDEENYNIISGIMLGEKPDSRSEIRKLFSDAGVMHLLVASGFNVSFVTVIIYFLCAFFGVKDNLRLPLALVFAGFYTLLAGADTPLLRAYLMTLMTGAGLMLKRNSGGFQGLLLAALLILIFSPASLFDVSFQMSFLSVFIILFVFSAVKIPSKIPAVVAFILKIFLTTLAVQLALIPVYTNVFFRFSLTSFISNIFLGPLAEAVMLAGFIFYAVSLLGINFLFKIFWAITWCLAELFKILVHFFGGFSFSAVTVPALNTASIICFYVSLLLFIFVKKKYKIFCLAALFLSPFLTFIHRPQGLYLLNNGGQNAVVDIGKNIIVFTDNFNPEVLNKFILSKSYFYADILYGKQTDVAEKQFIPFKDFWPGEEINGVKTRWGLMNGRNGQWINEGYSGTYLDGVTYEYNGLTVGGRADFLLKDGVLFENAKNAELKLK